MTALCVYSALFMVLLLWNSSDGKTQAQEVGRGVTQLYDSINLVVKGYKDRELLDKLVTKIAEESLTNGSDVSQCSAAMNMFLDAWKSEKDWALKMVDSSSKLPPGLMDGNLVDLGAYDECVEVVSGVTNGTAFSGQHCLIALNLNFSTPPDFAPPAVLAVLGNSLAFTFALCVPSTCTPATLELSLAAVADDINDFTAFHNLTVRFSVEATDCHVKHRPPLDSVEVLGVIVTLCSLILVAISTAFDLTLVRHYGHYVYRTQELPGCLRVLTAFSVHTNWRRLMDSGGSADSLDVLHCLKFLSIAWVVVGHRMRISIQAPLSNLLKTADFIKDWSSMLVLNATLAVDVFFLISGVLNTYVYMNLARRHGKTLQSHLVGYVHRYLRLTPAYALMILVTATWLYRLGDGPLWDRLVGTARRGCTQNWWSNLLYFNNYYHTNNNCMMQSWYLAADMQLFWLSPIVLYPLWRWPIIGMVNLILLVIISIIVPFLVAFFDEIKTPIPISFDAGKVNREMAELYFPTHTKAVSYLVGIVTGYCLHLLRSNQLTVNIRGITNAAAWTWALVAMAYGLFGGHYLFQLDSPYDRWQSSVYIGVYRFLWSAGLAWVIFACTAGYGGIIHGWLSTKVFAPLGRLTYCVYLTHAAVILYSVGSLRLPQHFTLYEMIMKSFGELVIATLLAILLSLTIEAPAMVLEKIIFLKEKRDSQRTHTDPSSEGLRASHPHEPL